MLKTSVTSTFSVPQDVNEPKQARPITWDWLLAFFFPMIVIGKLHSLAGIRKRTVWYVLAAVSVVTTVHILAAAKIYFDFYSEMDPSTFKSELTGDELLQPIIKRFFAAGILKISFFATARFRAISGNSILICIGLLYDIVMYARILFAYYCVFKSYAVEVNLDCPTEVVTASEATSTAVFWPPLALAMSNVSRFKCGLIEFAARTAVSWTSTSIFFHIPYFIVVKLKGGALSSSIIGDCINNLILSTILYGGTLFWSLRKIRAQAAPKTLSNI